MRGQLPETLRQFSRLHPAGNQFQAAKVNTAAFKRETMPVEVHREDVFAVASWQPTRPIVFLVIVLATLSMHSLTAGLDLLVQPVIHLSLDPADGTAAEGYGLREATLRNAKIDGAAGKAGASLDGGKA